MFKITNNYDLLRVDSCVSAVLFAVPELFYVDFPDLGALFGEF